MTILHHPSEATLLRHAAGTLSEGLSLVVATHLGFCPECQGRTRQLESMAGALLEQEPPLALAPDALDKTLRRLDAPLSPAVALQPAPEPAILPEGIRLPPTLRPYTFGRWRALGPGLRYSAIGVAPRKGAKVMLLRGAPGAVMAAHGHGKTEFTCVLSGSFTDDTGRYGPGDMAEATSSLDHQPVIGTEQECISLVAIEGKLRLRSLMGRLVSPLLGF